MSGVPKKALLMASANKSQMFIVGGYRKASAWAATTPCLQGYMYAGGTFTQLTFVGVPDMLADATSSYSFPKKIALSADASTLVIALESNSGSTSSGPKILILTRSNTTFTVVQTISTYASFTSTYAMNDADLWISDSGKTILVPMDTTASQKGQELYFFMKTGATTWTLQQTFSSTSLGGTGVKSIRTGTLRSDGLYVATYSQGAADPINILKRGNTSEDVWSNFTWVSEWKSGARTGSYYFVVNKSMAWDNVNKALVVASASINQNASVLSRAVTAEYNTPTIIYPFTSPYDNTVGGNTNNIQVSTIGLIVMSSYTTSSYINFDTTNSPTSYPIPIPSGSYSLTAAKASFVYGPQSTNTNINSISGIFAIATLNTSARTVSATIVSPKPSVFTGSSIGTLFAITAAGGA